MTLDLSIAETARRCFNAFQECLEKSSFISPREMSWVEDQFARFSLWTANIGVFASGRASLDHRLREAQEVHEVITGLLEAMDDKILECTSYLMTCFNTESDSIQEVVQETFDKHVQGLASQINLLYRLSNTIRKASSETQNAKAANTFKILDDEGNDAEPLLEVVFSNYVRDKFRSIDEKILKRLVHAMITRRKRVLYKRSRYGDLALRVKYAEPQPKTKAPQYHQQQNPALEAMSEEVNKNRSGAINARKSVVDHYSQSGLSATTLAIDRFKKASAPSVISGTKSVAFDKHEDLPFPPPPLGRVRRKYKQQKRVIEENHNIFYKYPELAGVGAAFGSDTLSEELKECWDKCLRAVGEVTCPFCFYAIPATDISDNAKWRSHVRNDLDAYVCLFEECNDEHKLFIHSEEWLRHMREHALRWLCNSKSHGTIVFGSREEYIKHLQQEHKGNFSDAQLCVLADRNGRQIGPLFESCPFCGFDDTSSNIKIEEHIVGHLRFLALKSLPPYEDERSEVSDAESTSSGISGPRKRSTIENDPDRHLLLVYEDINATDIDGRSEGSPPEYEALNALPETVRGRLEWDFVTQIYDQNVNADSDHVLQHIAIRQHRKSTDISIWDRMHDTLIYFLNERSLQISSDEIQFLISKHELSRILPLPESFVAYSDPQDRICFEYMQTTAVESNWSAETQIVSHEDQYLSASRRQIKIELRGVQMTVTKTDRDGRVLCQSGHKLTSVSSQPPERTIDPSLLCDERDTITKPFSNITKKEPTVPSDFMPEKVKQDPPVDTQSLSIRAIEPERQRDGRSSRYLKPIKSLFEKAWEDYASVIKRKEVEHISEKARIGEIPKALPRLAMAGKSILVNPNLTSQQSEIPNLDDSVLNDMIHRLLTSPGSAYKKLCISNEEISTLCTYSRELFLSQPVLLELQAPVKIVGDIHGQYPDLLRMFEMSGYPPNVNYLFLGDYVDRGKFGLETILLLICYKLKYPDNFFLLRGNHECANVTRVYGLYDECKRRCNVKTWKNIIDVFNCLPIAAIVSEKIFCVHGGLSPSLGSIDDIRGILRPTDIPEHGLLTDLVWSDPELTEEDWGENERGVSYTFNKNVISEFLEKFNLDLICRAHMVVEDGYEFFEDRLLVTIFTAPNYCGEFDNWGAIMAVSEDLLCSFELLKPL